MTAGCPDCGSGTLVWREAGRDGDSVTLDGYCSTCRAVVAQRTVTTADLITASRQRIRAQLDGSKLARPMPARCSFKAVGVSFVTEGPRAYPENARLIEHAWFVSHILPGHDGRRLDDDPAEGIAVLLIRNPDNPHDENAIEIHVPSIGAFVGHVPANVACRLAPDIDAGAVWQAEVNEVRTHPDYPDRPGIDIRAWRIPSDS